MAALVMRLLPVISILIDFFVMIYLIFLMIYRVTESSLSVLKQLRARSTGFVDFYVEVLKEIMGFKRVY